MPKILDRKNTSFDDRAQEYARLATAGIRPKEIVKALGLGQTSTLVHVRRNAKAAGYLDAGHKGRDERILAIQETKLSTAELTTQILHMDMERELNERICHSDDEEYTPKTESTKLAKDILDVTGYSGRKTEPPKVQVSIHQEIQENTVIGLSILKSALDKIKKAGVSIETLEQAAGVYEHA